MRVFSPTWIKRQTGFQNNRKPTNALWDNAWIIAHLHPQIQKMLDNIDLSVGGSGVQGRIALLVFTRDFCTMVNQQRHDIQVAFINKATENTMNLLRTIWQFIPPELSPSTFTATSIFLSCV